MSPRVLADKFLCEHAVGGVEAAHAQVAEHLLTGPPGLPGPLPVGGKRRQVADDGMPSSAPRPAYLPCM